MALPLAAALILALAVPAPAAPDPDSPPSRPKTYEAALAELSGRFEKGTDVSTIEAGKQPESFTKLLEQAKYVQKGREPGDEEETYATFIRSVARRLGVNSAKAVALYLKRGERPPRLEAAPRTELEARAAIAEDVRRNPGISAAKKARIARDMNKTSEYLRKGLNGDGAFAAFAEHSAAAGTEYQSEVAIPAAASQDGRTVQQDWSKVLPRVQPVALVTNPTPSPVQNAAPAAGPLPAAWASLTSLIDWEKGKQVAQEAFTGTLNYAKRMGKMCYMFVKQALIDAGVIDAPNPSSVGQIGLRPGAAKYFNADVKKNPKILDEMGYRQVDLAQANDDPKTIPDGSLLVYNGGCAFADPTNGHAELTVSEQTYTELRSKNTRLRGFGADPNEVRVCHFSCTTRSMPFLRTYGKRGCLKMYVPIKNS